MRELERITARRGELDTLAEELAKQLQVQAEREELIIAERVLHRRAEQDRAAEQDASVTAPLRILDWEGWGRAPEGFDAASVAARVRTAFPVLGSPAGLAAEATVCPQLLQTVSRGDNLPVEDRLRAWSEELRRR
jgi:hypothetical protein